MEASSRYIKQWRANNRARTTAYKREWRNRNRKSSMIHGAKARARKMGLSFDLTEASFDIPSHCPILGTPLEFGKGRTSANSPALDRFDPSKGYVEGNVNVISHRANALKSNLSLDELRLKDTEEYQLITKWMETIEYRAK